MTDRLAPFQQHLPRNYRDRLQVGEDASESGARQAGQEAVSSLAARRTGDGACTGEVGTLNMVRTFTCPATVVPIESRRMSPTAHR